MKTMNKPKMKYTLITSKGKVMGFYIKAVADLYHTLEGGVLVTENVLKVSEYKEVA